MLSDEAKHHSALKWRLGSNGAASGKNSPGNNGDIHGSARAVDESLAVEEPLEIRLGGRRFTLTMRTPGHDEELAAGFLLAEGFIDLREELGEVRRLRMRGGSADPNAIDVILAVPADDLRGRLKRNFTISSSCGVCGKTSIDALRRRVAPLADQLRVTARALLAMPHQMRTAQEVFEATGGLHAAALFGVAYGGDAADLQVLREDVGRHNAVDKVIGRALMDGRIPLRDSIMMVSGRLSFEIVQKAASAGIQLIASVSAPSSLAVELADEFGMTLAGFVRESSFNIYTHRERVIV
jgi:FdhD protein